jgi:hypothetical protein
MSTEFKNIVDILSVERLAGGSLAGQGNSFFASDFDEPAVVIRTGEDLMWEVKHVDGEELAYVKDLLQFAMEIKGSPVMVEGIDKLMSVQGYEVTEGRTFDIPPVDGVGDISKYEARIVNRPRTIETRPIPAKDNINTKFNYVEPTGQ